MRWHEMTRPDFENIGPETVIVWPLGSTEQHGEHLPVGTDTFLISDIGRRIEAARPDRVLLLPTLPIGASHHHRAFAGALTLPELLYTEMLVEAVGAIIADEVCAAGRSKRIFLLNGHGGNIAPGQTAISEIAYRHRDRSDVIVAFTSYWHSSADAMARAGCETDRLTHACEYETSMVLAIRGELVRMDRARAGSVNWEGTRITPDASRSSAINVAVPFHARSSNGALGRPDLASAEKGERLLSAVAFDLAAFIDEFVAWPDLRDARER